MEASDHLISLVFRIPKESLEAIKGLSARTRVRQSEYFREAIEDLLTKYSKSTGSAQ